MLVIEKVIKSQNYKKKILCHYVLNFLFVEIKTKFLPHDIGLEKFALHHGEHIKKREVGTPLFSGEACNINISTLCLPFLHSVLYYKIVMIFFSEQRCFLYEVLCKNGKKIISYFDNIYRERVSFYCNSLRDTVRYRFLGVVGLILDIIFTHDCSSVICISWQFFNTF